MAKTAVKTAAKTASKASSSKPVAKAPGNKIEKISEEVLVKLQSLGIDQQLQSELEWCLGSYRFDQNPSGLYLMAERALNLLNDEKNKKTKGVTTKLIGDLETVLKERA